MFTKIWQGKVWLERGNALHALQILGNGMNLNEEDYKIRSRLNEKLAERGYKGSHLFWTEGFIDDLILMSDEEAEDAMDAALDRILASAVGTL